MCMLVGVYVYIVISHSYYDDHYYLTSGCVTLSFGLKKNRTPLLLSIVRF